MHLKILNREAVLYIFFILMRWDLSGDLHFCECSKGKTVISGTTERLAILTDNLWIFTQKIGQIPTI